MIKTRRKPCIASFTEEKIIWPKSEKFLQIVLKSKFKKGNTNAERKQKLERYIKEVINMTRFCEKS